MRSERMVQVVSAHAEGEVGDVIIGGVAPPPGNTVWEMRNFIADDGRLRSFVLNEPRGGVHRHVNLLVPPTHPDAKMGFIIMEPEFTPPMSGSNTICVATVLLECGLIPMMEPVTEFTLEAPGGLVQIRASCDAGKVRQVTLQNMPSFVCEQGIDISLPDFGTLTVDTAFGGDSFVVVDASDVGFDIRPEEARAIAETGLRITGIANRVIGFSHPRLKEWNTISFCLFVGKTETSGNHIMTRTAVAIQPGKVDRSPTGTGVSALMALLHGQGRMKPGQTLTARSIIGSSFTGRISKVIETDGMPAIIPEISGQAWITGTHQYMLDPDDPWPEGYRLSDTWGCKPPGDT